MKTGKFNSIVILLLVLTLIVGLLNLYLRKLVPGSYSVQLSYNQLYLDPSVLRLKNAMHQNENLKIELAGSFAGISSNIQAHNGAKEGTFIFTPADTGKMFWIKSPYQPDSLFFSISYSSDAFYKLSSHSGKSNYEIQSSTLNYTGNKLYTHHRWAYDFSELNKREDSFDVVKYIHDSIGIQGTESSLKKIEKIFGHLMPFVKPNLGIPADSVGRMSVMKLLDCLKKNQVKVWCGNLTEILGFFATQSGLPCRKVTTEGYEQFSFPIHAFNEIYIPEEKKWIYSDLTTGIAYASIDNKPINVIDLSRLLRVGIKNSNAKVIYYEDSLNEIGLDNIFSVVNPYFNAPQRFRYYYPRFLSYGNQPGYIVKIKKFFDPHLNYAFYSEDNHYSTNSHLWRQISIYLLFPLLLIDVILVFILFGKKISKLINLK